MLSFVVRRLLAILPVLLAVSLLTFLIASLLPGDLAYVILGDQAATLVTANWGPIDDLKISFVAGTLDPQFSNVFFGANGSHHLAMDSFSFQVDSSLPYGTFYVAGDKLAVDAVLVIGEHGDIDETAIKAGLGI